MKVTLEALKRLLTDAEAIQPNAPITYRTPIEWIPGEEGVIIGAIQGYVSSDKGIEAFVKMTSQQDANIEEKIAEIKASGNFAGVPFGGVRVVQFYTVEGPFGNSPSVKLFQELHALGHVTDITVKLYVEGL